MIEKNDSIPSATLTERGEAGIDKYDPELIFSEGTHVLFGVPGAFTPTCSEKHLPEFVEKASDFRDAGVESVVCVSVNDCFVMDAWGKDNKVGDKVRMLADGDGSFHEKIGLIKDTGSFGGKRAKRYAMIIHNGCVTDLFVEEDGTFGVSRAGHVLEAIQKK